MPMAGTMVVRSRLVGVRRHFVAVTLKMTDAFGRDLGTINCFCSMRSAAGPEDQHQHKGADEG